MKSIGWSALGHTRHISAGVGDDMFAISHLDGEEISTDESSGMHCNALKVELGSQIMVSR